MRLSPARKESEPLHHLNSEAGSTSLHFVMFYHSVISDWNHGNAHFLRGVISALQARGHSVSVYEPTDAWSMTNLMREHGQAAVRRFRRRFPHISLCRYAPNTFDLNSALDGADVVIVHEWNDHALVKRIGEHRKRHGSYKLFFHDTHHRAITESDSIRAYDLSNYDGVLAFGAVLRDVYIKQSLTAACWVWHEAADTRVFRPLTFRGRKGDIIWIGNWGDNERTQEVREFLLNPARKLELRGSVFGVRYPEEALSEIRAAGLEYGGWIPNYEVPKAFARHRLTVHVPRRPYVESLHGIPTIRPFEAMACGIPLISAPWHDTEHLFTPDQDFLVARSGQEMERLIHDVLSDGQLAESLHQRGLTAIRTRHTCEHRVDQLMEIIAELRSSSESKAAIA